MITLMAGAVGSGRTPLAAFDAALVAAGVADRNLICLSSVLPRAGIGWVQDASGRGLLVEHHAHDEVSVRGMVRASLEGLCRNRGVSFPSGGIEVAGASCVDEPVCALVVAVFESAAWMSASQPARVAA